MNFTTYAWLIRPRWDQTLRSINERERKKRRDRGQELCKMSNTFNSPALIPRLMPPPVMNNTPQTTSCVACLWARGRNYRVLTFPLLFGMQKYKENSCKVCTHRRAYYTNSVSFFLFERLWKLTPPLLSSPTTENLRMYRMMSEKKIAFWKVKGQMKASSWPC